MEELIINDRKRRAIIWHTPHVPQQIHNRKLFSSVETGLKKLKKAIRKIGIFIPSFKDGECLCIFWGDVKKMVVCPVVLRTRGLFFIPTIYEAEKWHKRAYKEVRRRKSNK
ncbi:MAG: hypothetical protein ACFFDN_29030 [Candidatus Hodarchaeota archaeon]